MIPKLNPISRSRDMIQEFGGVNHNVRANDNEFYDVNNTSSENYPTLSPRTPRAVVKNIENCGGLHAKDKLLYIENDKLHYGETVIDLEAGIENRKIVSMGAYVIVYPDFVYLNTANLEDCGEVLFNGGVYPEKNTAISFELCFLDGTNVFDQIMYVKGSEWEEDLIVRAENKIDMKYGGALERYIKNQEETYISNAFYHCFSHIDEKVYSSLHDYEFTSSDGSTSKLFIDEVVISTDKIKYHKDNDGRVSFTVKDYFKGVAFAYAKGRIIHADGTETNVVHTNGKYYMEIKHYMYPLNDEYMLDNTVSPTQVKKFKDGEWHKVDTFVKISSHNIGRKITAPFTKLTFLNDYQNVLRDVLNESFNERIIKTLNTNTIMIPGVLSTGVTKLENIEGSYIKIRGKYVFDYIVESQNRLWACRFGKNEEGHLINEIYASALGDFEHWYGAGFDKVDTDPYVVNLGSDGEFTGAVNYNGYPIFFKENCIHRIYGNNPSSFQVTTENSFGVEKGSDKSLQVISGVLFYKSVDGIYAYDGASTSLVSQKLGLGRFSGAISGNVNNKYYVSMVSAEDKARRMYVYDVMKGIWNIEDDTGTVFMERFDDNLYIATESGELLTVKDKKGGSNEKVSWYAETGVIGYSSPDAKYVSQIQLRVSLDVDAELNIYIEYDSSGDFEHKGSIRGTRLQSFTIPIMPRRCDHFRMRFEGVGNCKIFSLTKILENGGNL